MVFVIDHDASVRAAIACLVESNGLAVETFSDAAVFLRQHDPQRPGCIILDMCLPGLSGSEFLEHLSQHPIRPPVICITAVATVRMAVHALQHGAIDFLEKPVSDTLLMSRIREALKTDAQARDARVEAADTERRIASLSEREREVMDLVVAGLSTKGIARHLHRSAKTIEKHRVAMMRKIQANNVAELVRLVTETRRSSA